MRLRPVLAVLLAAPTLGCGGASEAASCIGVVELGGHSYYAHSEPGGPVPTTGEVVGAVRPGCDDTGEAQPDEDVQVGAIAGVPTEVAVLHDGVVHLREGARMPAAAGSWFASASCSRVGTFRLGGRWEGVSEPAAPHFDGVLDPPYDLAVAVEEGPRALVGATLDVQVVPGTDPVLATSDLPRLGTARLGLTVRCEEGGFVAVRVSIR